MRMTIRTRVLFAAIGFAVAIIAAAAGTIWLQSVGVRVFDTVLADRVTPMRQLKHVSDAYAVSIVDTAHKVRSGAVSWDEGSRLVLDAESVIATDWTAYRQTLLTRQEAELLGIAESQKRETDHAVATLGGILAAHDGKALADFIDHDLYPAVDPLTKTLGQLVRIQEQETTRLRDEAMRQNRILLGVRVLVVCGMLAAVLWFAWYVIARVARPLGQFSTTIRALGRGDVGVPIAGLDRKDEIGVVAGALLELRDRRIETDSLGARITQLAHYDPLTGLPNRCLLDDWIAGTVIDAELNGSRFAVLLLDIDRFRQVTELFGTSGGEQLIVAVAHRLSGLVDGQIRVARLSADLFAILHTGPAQPATAAVLAQRLIGLFGAPFQTGDHHVRVGTSIGISVFPFDGRDADTLIGHAETALNRAKGAGGGRFHLFEESMDTAVRTRRILTHDLSRALGTGQIELHYQPIADAATRDITGFEALVRWRHPDRGMISPLDFIALAEESGTIVQLGAWVLKKACADAARWHRPLTVSVNVSPAQIRHGHLPALVEAVLKETGLPAERLQLEITEGMLIKDGGRTRAVLQELRTLGVSIAMDDFGTGYSSLSYLQSFPFDKIKIDGAFIRDLAPGTQSEAIVRTVIGLANVLGMKIVAERVETDEQLELLRHDGCQEVQGYLISAPKPLEAFEHIIGKVPAPALA